MNDLETLLQLVMLLAKYGNSVIVHDVFRDELAGLLAKSGSEDKFFKRLASYIQQLVENGEAAIGLRVHRSNIWQGKRTFVL